MTAEKARRIFFTGCRYSEKGRGSGIDERIGEILEEKCEKQVRQKDHRPRIVWAVS